MPSLLNVFTRVLALAAGAAALPGAPGDSGGANPSHDPTPGPQAHPLAGRSADVSTSALSAASPSAPVTGGARAANPSGGASAPSGGSGNGTEGSDGGAGNPDAEGLSGGGRPVGGANGGHLGGGARSPLLLRTLVSKAPEVNNPKLVYA